VDHIESREQVEVVLGRLVDLVNRIWDSRSAIEPDHSTHKQLQPLELFRLLPRTNCRLCGESTCFNFALKLVAAQTDLAACQPLAQDKDFEANRQQLEKLVATRWPAL